MIKLPKSVLRGLVEIIYFANTPKSLFKAILRSRAFDILTEKCSESALSKYYDELTARPQRTPLVAAIAYTVLIAFLRKSKSPELIDASRLEWGEQILPHATSSSNSSGIIIIPGNTYPEPKVTLVSSDGVLSSSFTIQTPKPKNMIIV